MSWIAVSKDIRGDVIASVQLKVNNLEKRQSDRRLEEDSHYDLNRC